MSYSRFPCNTIVRVWSGKVSPSKADEYERFLRERAVPDYSRVSGNLGGVILRADNSDFVEFTILTFWDSLDSVKNFAGSDYDRAKYYEEDRGFLLEFPERVKHYKITTCF